MDFFSTFVRLSAGAAAEPLPVNETFWQRLMSGQLGNFHNELLIAGGTYDKDWSSWEMHPNGDEIVCLLSGSVTFIIEQADGTQEVELKESGAYLVVPKGHWHTARTQGPSRLLFITPGEGTQHRPLQ